jgi:hypothetical protein
MSKKVMGNVVYRNPNDWAALRKAVKKGRGAIEALMSEAMEKPTNVQLPELLVAPSMREK